MALGWYILAKEKAVEMVVELLSLDPSRSINSTAEVESDNVRDPVKAWELFLHSELETQTEESPDPVVEAPKGKCQYLPRCQ